MTRFLQTLRTSSARALVAIGAVVGLDELVLLAALVLITAGLWASFEAGRLVGLSALVVPGLVGLWCALPQRESFVHRTPAEAPGRKR